MSVLVVEDDRDSLANLMDILSWEGFQVHGASSAQEAREVIRHHGAPRVVVLDRRLPDTDAETFLPELQSLSRDSDVIIVTGYADLDSTIGAMRLGASDYLLKPVNPEALLTSVRRLLERQAMRRAWHEEHEFAERVLETTEAIVLVLGLDGSIQRCNPFFEQMTGWSSAEAIGENWFERFVPVDEVEPLRATFDKTIAGEHARGIVNSVLRRDGEIRVIRWSNAVLKDHARQVIGVLAVGLDITDIIEAQNKLLQHERLAVIGETMAALAHESRNSLQRIRAKVDLLQLELQDNAQAMDDLASIAKATDDLHRLLEEVRGYAAPIHLDLTMQQLDKVWRRAFEEVQQSHPRATMQLSENCPEQPLAVVDAQRMRQVFRNLFENSVMAAGDQVQLFVEASLDPDGSVMQVAVSDDGPGFQGARIDRIFDAFYTTRPTGTGLGMAIVRRILEAHGGSIRVDESYDRGARILLTIPVKPPRREGEVA
ncbi:MAG: histidine kinase [Pirellulaceae bacterium]|nr:MAG: histidine kinase [Pirellulaceae bacterium]